MNKFVIQFLFIDGDSYSHILTAPILAESKEKVLDVIKEQGIKDVEHFKNCQLRDSWLETIFVDIVGERIFGNEFFLEKDNFRILTLDEWFNIPLKGDNWILNRD